MKRFISHAIVFCIGAGLMSLDTLRVGTEVTQVSAINQILSSIRVIELIERGETDSAKSYLKEQIDCNAYMLEVFSNKFMGDKTAWSEGIQKDTKPYIDSNSQCRELNL